MTGTQHTPTTIPDSVLAELNRRYVLFHEQNERALFGDPADRFWHEQNAERRWGQFLHFTQGVCAALNLKVREITEICRDRVTGGVS